MTKKQLQNLPLAINVFGPMAFKKNGKLLDIWLLATEQLVSAPSRRRNGR